MGKRNRERILAIKSGLTAPISVIQKGRELGEKIASEGSLYKYENVMGALHGKNTPQSERDGFVSRTLNQLKMEAKKAMVKFGDAEMATEWLMGEITPDKEYMRLISSVGLTEDDLRKTIKEAISASS